MSKAVMFEGLPVLAAGWMLVQQPTEPPDFGSATVVVLLGIYIAKEVIQLVATRIFPKNGNGKKGDPRLDELAGQVDDLHRWHNKTTDTGSFVWYNSRRELERMTTLLEEIRDLLRYTKP